MEPKHLTDNKTIPINALLYYNKQHEDILGKQINMMHENRNCRTQDIEASLPEKFLQLRNEMKQILKDNKIIEKEEH
jgi:hypothetical protein